ncbi:MAG: hypothetical protein ACREUT_04140 [Steroidobacteraceae bacterium]
MEELFGSAVAQLSRPVQQKVSASKIAKLGRQIGRQESVAATSEKAIARAQVGALAARSLMLVFAAHDVYEAWEECVEEWKSSY